jgi:hypothetical protein
MSIADGEQTQFEIKVDEKSKRLIIKMRGFWEDDTGARFQRAVQREIVKLHGTRWGLLLNLDDYKAQSSEVYSLIQRVLAHNKKWGMTQVAIVVTDAITRLQFKRLSQQCGEDGWTFHLNTMGAKLALSTEIPDQKTT